MSATPKVVIDAFIPAVVAVGTVRLQPITAAHYLALQKHKSPFVLGESTEIGMDAIIVALYIMQTPADQVLTIAGDPDFLQRVNAFAGRISLEHLPDVAHKLYLHLKAAYATRIANEDGGKEDADGAPFPASRRPKVAGGSSTRSRSVAPGTAGKSNTP